MRFDFYDKLLESAEFQDWQKKNPQAFLSHFYCQLDESFNLISPWEVGFYDPKKDTITTFVVGKEISLRPEEAVFKKEGSLKKLDLAKVKIKLAQALIRFKKIKEKYYSLELLLKGFAILQYFQNKTMWNLSFATRSMNILNIKIDAETSEVISHQLINFIERRKDEGKEKKERQAS